MAKTLYSERVSPQVSGKPEALPSLDPGLIKPATLNTLSLDNKGSELVGERAYGTMGEWQLMENTM